MTEHMFHFHLVMGRQRHVSECKRVRRAQRSSLQKKNKRPCLSGFSSECTYNSTFFQHANDYNNFIEKIASLITCANENDEVFEESLKNTPVKVKVLL